MNLITIASTLPHSSKSSVAQWKWMYIAKLSSWYGWGKARMGLKRAGWTPLSPPPPCRRPTLSQGTPHPGQDTTTWCRNWMKAPSVCDQSRNCSFFNIIYLKEVLTFPSYPSMDCHLPSTRADTVGSCRRVNSQQDLLSIYRDSVLPVIQCNSMGGAGC